MTYRYGWLVAWPLLLVAAVAAAQTVPAGADADDRLVRQILKHLGLDVGASLPTILGARDEADRRRRRRTRKLGRY